jgi:hypothetical protein
MSYLSIQDILRYISAEINSEQDKSHVNRNAKTLNRTCMSPIYLIRTFRLS